MYFTEYNESFHKEITRRDYGIGAGRGAKTPQQANGDDEYDVPQCSANEGQITTGDCNHTITGTCTCLIFCVTISRNTTHHFATCVEHAGMPVPKDSKQKVYLAAMHHHCHAPTCLRLDVWNNDTGDLICRVEPV